MSPPYGAIYCHAEAHINVDECGAPELYTGGAKLVGIDGPHGKLTPDLLEAAVSGAGNQHSVQPAAVAVFHDPNISVKEATCRLGIPVSTLYHYIPGGHPGFNGEQR